MSEGKLCTGYINELLNKLIIKYKRVITKGKLQLSNFYSALLIPLFVGYLSFVYCQATLVFYIVFFINCSFRDSLCDSF